MLGGKLQRFNAYYRGNQSRFTHRTPARYMIIRARKFRMWEILLVAHAAIVPADCEQMEHSFERKVFETVESGFALFAFEE